MEKLQNYINGELVPPHSNEYFENIEPAIGKPYSLIPDSDESDVLEATKAAKAAFPIWSKMSVDQRSEILLRIAELIGENLDELAAAESRDNGKPLKLAKTVDIPRAQANFHFYGTGILHFASESHSMGNLAINYTLRQPIGVAGCISPWNLPLYLFSWKIAPALASGNTVVAKPSEITPYTSYLLSKICIEAGLPKGVLNIVHGLGPKAGAAIIEHASELFQRVGTSSAYARHVIRRWSTDHLPPCAVHSEINEPRIWSTSTEATQGPAMGLHSGL